MAAVKVAVSRAPGAKCARCYRVLPEVGLVPEHPTACLRCVEVVTGEQHDVHALAAARFDRLYAAARAAGAGATDAVRLAGAANTGRPA